MMIFLYLSKQWLLIKIATIPCFIVIGPFVLTPFFSISADLLTGDMMGILLSIDKLVSVGMQNYFSLTFKKQVDDSGYWIPSLIFAIASAVAGSTIAVFMFESYGLTKVQLFEKLSGKKK